jgi:hypothetical protein
VNPGNFIYSSSQIDSPVIVRRHLCDQKWNLLGHIHSGEVLSVTSVLRLVKEKITSTNLHTLLSREGSTSTQAGPLRPTKSKSAGSGGRKMYVSRPSIVNTQQS